MIIGRAMDAFFFDRKSFSLYSLRDMMGTRHMRHLTSPSQVQKHAKQKITSIECTIRHLAIQ